MYIEQIGRKHSRNIVENADIGKYADSFLFENGNKLLISVYDKDTNNLIGYFFNDYTLVNILPSHICDDCPRSIKELALIKKNQKAEKLLKSFISEMMTIFKDSKYAHETYNYRLVLDKTIQKKQDQSDKFASLAKSANEKIKAYIKEIEQMQEK